MSDTINAKIYNMADLASKDWFRRQVNTLETQMYLYYKPHEINFYIGAEPLSDRWELARPERIPISLSTGQVTNLIYQLARRLPILS